MTDSVWYGEDGWAYDIGYGGLLGERNGWLDPTNVRCTLGLNNVTNRTFFTVIGKHGPEFSCSIINVLLAPMTTVVQWAQKMRNNYLDIVSNLKMGGG